MTESLGFSTFKVLSDDSKMPRFGISTSHIPENDLFDTLKEAIMGKGIRMFGVQHSESREQIVGKVLQECFASGIKREDLFIIGKLEINDIDHVEQALKSSLQNMQLDYLDLYVIHNMIPKIDKSSFKVEGFSIRDTWSSLEHLHNQGLVRSLGLINCPIVMLLEILSFCNVKPVVNSLEIHPYFQQQQVIDFHKRIGIALISHSPLPQKDIQSLDLKL